MRRSSRLTHLALGWALACTIGCTGPAMKVPETVQRSPPWKLAGYSEREGLVQRGFTLDRHAVREVRRTRTPMANANRMQEPGPDGYRFELASDGTRLEAECRQRVDPYELWILRFGKDKQHLDCRCREREATRVELSLVEGAGALRLSDGARYEVQPVHHTASGRHKRAILGYRIDGTNGSGAIQRTGEGRAWAPPSLAPGAARELACGYAALLLYKPDL